jgi:hypothetical protein
LASPKWEERTWNQWLRPKSRNRQLKWRLLKALNKKILTILVSASLLFAGCSESPKPVATGTPAAASSPAATGSPAAAGSPSVTDSTAATGSTAESPLSQSTPSSYKKPTAEDIEALKAKKLEAEEKYKNEVRGENSTDVPDPEDKNHQF